MSFSIPTKQKALVLPAARAEFEIQEINVPKPAAGDVLVRVESAGLNPAEWLIQKFDPFKLAYPTTLGFDAASTVVQLGEGVTELAVGDKVFHPGWLDPYATYKEYTLAPADLCVKVPSNLSIDQAAAVPSGFGTALIGLYAPPDNRGGANLVPFWREGGRTKYASQPILILGGSAAISQPAIQLARLSNFSPIITTASLKNAPLLKSLGATHVLDRNLSGEAFTSAVQEILGGKLLSVVYDGVSGPEIQCAAYELLAPGGSFVACTASRSHISKEKQASKEKIFAALHASPFVPDKRPLCVEFSKLLSALLESGELKPNHVEVLPGGLAGIPEGLKRLEEGRVSAAKLVAHPQETA